MRAKEHADSVAKERVSRATVSTLERALRVLTEKTDDIPATAKALLQLYGAPGRPEAVKSIIASFLLMSIEQGLLSHEAPCATWYELQLLASSTC